VYYSNCLCACSVAESSDGFTTVAAAGATAGTLSAKRMSTGAMLDRADDAVEEELDKQVKTPQMQQLELINCTEKVY
jgi:hypothetical protein